MSQPLDTLIIGAGSAGLAALREVRKHTDRFLIVNEGPWGTTCARVGCMPSKLFIEAANALHARHAFDDFGLRGATALSADLPAVLERVRALRDDFVAGTLQTTGAEARKASGAARLLGPNRVEVGGHVHEARSIVIATGSRPVMPEEWLAFGDRVLTTDTLFEQPTLGPRLAVVGLGPIGVELAQAAARLGVEVTAFATAPKAAALSDPQVTATLLDALRREYTVHVGKAAQLREVAGGIEVSNGAATVVVDQVLAAMGRQTNIEYLGLDALGVDLNEHGLPAIDPATLQIGALPVFMAGDATPDRPLLHEAVDEGHIAGINALRVAQGEAPRRFRRRTPLSIVFCQPNAATVGTRHADLPEGGHVLGQVDFTRQGRARVARRAQGRLHVYAQRGSGRLLGAELCAPDGEHLAHLLALAVDGGLTVHELLRMPFYHPVIEEGLRTALRDAAAQLPPGSDSDLSDCESLGCSALD